jgi:plastocyanin
MLKQVCAAVAIACAFGCGGGGGDATNTTTPPPVGNTPPPAGGISVTNDAYSPGTKSVAVGTEIRWAWNTCSGDPYYGQTCVAHSVTFDDGVTSPTQEQGTFTRTFAAAGTYNYHCAVHGAAMTGSITVQ